MFPISIFARASLGLGLAACAACAAMDEKRYEAPAPQAFYTVTGEMALARHQPRQAALQYAAAAAQETDTGLLERAAQVAAEALQPSLAEKIAARWSEVDPKSVEAHRAAGRAALALQRIDRAAAHYRIVIDTSPLGAEAELAALESYLAANDNIFGSRQLADRLAAAYPSSPAALRARGSAALRADDPAAAVESFTAALALPGSGKAVDEAARREMRQTVARARILAGDAEGTLAQAREKAEREDTPVNHLDYALLLMAAQRGPEAAQQLQMLERDAEYAPAALRLMGLAEFELGHLEGAAEKFAELVRADKDLDDAFYYLALIADRHGDAERALRFYAQVQSGENTMPALLRASALLETHGAAAAGEDLLDHLIEDEPLRAPGIISARARIYADAGDVPRAVAVLEQGLVEYPDIVDLRYAIASIYEEAGRVADALRELNELVKARPDDPAALNALGYTLADHSRDLARARRLIDTAHAASPKNPAILDSMGWVRYRQGQSAAAEGYLREAYADDRSGDIAAHLGEVLWREGKAEDAEKIWYEAGAVDADNRVLKATRRRFGAQSAPGAQPAPAVH